MAELDNKNQISHLNESYGNAIAETMTAIKLNITKNLNIKRKENPIGPLPNDKIKTLLPINNYAPVFIHHRFKRAHAKIELCASCNFCTRNLSYKRQ